MKIRLIVLFAMLCASAHAQLDLQWAKHLEGLTALPPWLGSTHNDDGNAIRKDLAGNIYVAGKIEGATDMDPSAATAILTPVDSLDGFVAKYDANGNYLWAFVIGGVGLSTCYQLEIGPSGNIYVTGHVWSQADADPSASTALLGTGDFIAVYDNSGSFIWAQSIPVSEYLKMALDSDENIYLHGAFSGTYDFDFSPGVANLASTSVKDIFLAKYDLNGNYIWASKISVDVEYPVFGITVDDNDNIYLCGVYYGTVDFDLGPGVINQTSIAIRAGYIAKYDSAGGLIWINSIQSTTPGYSLIITPKCIRVDQANNVYLGGSFYGEARFNPAIPWQSISSNEGMDIFMAKYNLTGNNLWAYYCGGEYDDALQDVMVDSLENIVVMGHCSSGGDINFLPTETDFLFPLSTSSLTSFIAQYNKDCHYVWAINTGTKLYPRSMMRDNSSNIYLAGSVGLGPADLDFSAGVLNITESAGLTDIFFAKYKLDSCAMLAIQIDSVQDVDCIGLGFASVTAKGGLAPYEYEWSTSPITNDSAAVFNAAGAYTITVTDSNSCMRQRTLLVDGVEYALDYDLNVNLIPPAEFRTGFTSAMNLNTLNNGCTYTPGVLSLVLDPLTFFNGSFPAPDIVSGDTLKWNLPSFNYQSPHFIHNISFTTLGAIGDTLCFDVWVTPITGDADTTNNHKTYCFPVINGYDPNDKQVYPQGECTPNFVLKDQTLTYTIRFQNTGNADAINIHIIDSLNANLDLSSVRIVGKSHDLVTEVLPGNVLKFNFDNIHLPDSTTNEPASHGYVIFEVDPFAGVPNGTLVENTSHIFFDYNPAVVTNTVSSTLVSSIPHYSTVQNISLACGDSYVFPDGYVASDILTPVSHTSYLSSVLYCDSTIITHITLNPLNTTLTIAGATLTAAPGYTYEWLECTIGATFADDFGQAFNVPANGVYAVIVSNGLCRDTSACVTINLTGMDEQAGISPVNIYPNPANNTLTIETGNAAAQSITLCDVYGRTVQTVIPQAAKTTVDISALAKGIYMVHVNTGHGMETVKVIKQ